MGPFGAARKSLDLLTRDFPFLGLQEFEIELEGSQTLRILCYEKCYNKTKITKEDGESTDRIMGKGQVQVRLPPSSAPCRVPLPPPSAPLQPPTQLRTPASEPADTLLQMLQFLSPFDLLGH